MANDVGSLHPNDEKLGAFALLTDFLLKNSVSRTILRTIHYGLFAISPSVPDTFLDLVRRKSTRRAFWWGAGLTFFFCFIVITVWSIVDGTFSGADSTRVYFSKDLTNLLEYILICPVYVGLSVQLIVLVLASYARLCRPTGLAETAAVTLPRTSIGVSAFIVLALSASITINYIKEVLDPRLYPKVGWWVERVTADGTRVLSPLGLYYAILNFSLLSICLTNRASIPSAFFPLCSVWKNDRRPAGHERNYVRYYQGHAVNVYQRICRAETPCCRAGSTCLYLEDVEARDHPQFQTHDHGISDFWCLFYINTPLLYRTGVVSVSRSASARLGPPG